MTGTPEFLATAIHYGGWKWTGEFTTIDLIAATTNALNGALLARRPDHYRNLRSSGFCSWRYSAAWAAASPVTCS